MFHLEIPTHCIHTLCTFFIYFVLLIHPLRLFVKEFVDKYRDFAFATYFNVFLTLSSPMQSPYSQRRMMTRQS